MENNPQGKIHSETATVFRPDIIKEILKSKFTNPKNKITEESLELMSEISKALAIEAALRAGKVATRENKTTVSLQHVEMILPQLMLDFP